ncbi:MAG: hypothetical protein AAGG02_09955 [Cyanobacteria bacterium P01_H01_bin.15]
MSKRQILMAGLLITGASSLFAGSTITPAVWADSGTHHHDAQDHSAPPKPKHDHEVGHHHHGTLEVPAGMPVPEVEISVTPDPLMGWNLEVVTDNFELIPSQANLPSQVTEGHAHLYINGEKITRLYGNWYYLGTLPPGEHTVKVTLNANNHEDILNAGEVIGDSILVTVPSP